MNKGKRYYRLIEKFCESKFEKLEIVCEEHRYEQSSGFFLNQKSYFLGDTLILYEWERPDGFKVAFNYEFFREVQKFIPVRGYKQHIREWIFKKKFPTFEHKDKLQKKFSFY